MNVINNKQNIPAASPPWHDLVIIGGGPAGLTAAIYGARDKLSVLIIEKAIIGGLITETDRIDNYPGFPDGISGFELTDKMFKQAQKYGTEDTIAEVLSIDQVNSGFIVRTTENSFPARAVIVAGGSSHLRLNIPGEKEYTGRGVSYCATCDAPFYNDKNVAVVGGGNAAIYEAIHLAKFARKVYLIHRRSEYRATPIVQDIVGGNPKIEPILDTIIEAVGGNDFVEKIRLLHKQTNESSELVVDGLFVAVGQKPNTAYLHELLELDTHSAIVVNDCMATSVPGIFAAGDVRRHSIRQAIAAASDGAIAALEAKKWLEGTHTDSFQSHPHQV